MKLFKFEKDGCVPCQRMQLYLDDHEVEVIKVNPFDNPEMAAKYDIASVPTLILFDEEGVEVGRSIGFVPVEIDYLASLMNKDGGANA